MRINEIKFGSIYKAVGLPEEHEIYGYVRGWRENKVGFSVLDEASNEPDLSDCGIFWVSSKDFAMMFDVYK